MYLRLTFYNSAKTVLVNMDQVKLISQAYDTRNSKYSTKLTYKIGNKTKGKYINVSESPQTILKLIQDYQQGIFQNTNWYDTDLEFLETEEFHEF